MFSKRNLLLSAFIIFLFSSCQSSPTPETTPIPTSTQLADIRLWQIEFTPATAWMGSIFNSCTLQLEDTAIIVTEKPYPYLDPTSADFVFHLKPFDDFDNNEIYTAVLGQVDIDIIINSKNPTPHLSYQQLREIYSGEISDWKVLGESPASGSIQIWTYPAQDDLQSLFNENLGLAPTNQNSYLAPDPSAMRQAIATNVTAIGFLPSRWNHDDVKTLTIENSPETNYSLLVTTSFQPKDDQMTWILCLQDVLSW